MIGRRKEEWIKKVADVTFSEDGQRSVEPKPTLVMFPGLHRKTHETLGASRMGLAGRTSVTIHCSAETGTETEPDHCEVRYYRFTPSQYSRTASVRVIFIYLFFYINLSTFKNAQSIVCIKLYPENRFVKY